MAMKNKYIGFICRNPVTNIMTTIPTIARPKTQGSAFLTAVTSTVRGSSGGALKMKSLSLRGGPARRRRCGNLSRITDLSSVRYQRIGFGEGRARGEQA